MNYKDVVIRILRKRDNISILEENLLIEFNNSDKPEEALEQWYIKHRIIATRTEGQRFVTLSRSNKPDKKSTD